MGCNASVSSEDAPVCPAMGEDFTKEQFEMNRNKTTVQMCQSYLSSHGFNLGIKEPKDLPNTLKTCCYMCINNNSNYAKPQEVDAGPYNDAIITAREFQHAGHPVYYIENPTRMKYFQFLRTILSKTTETVYIYITGSCHDVKDETFLVFADDEVPGAQFSSFLKCFKLKTSRVFLLFDLSHVKIKENVPLIPQINLVPNTIFACNDFIENTYYDNSTTIPCGGYLTYVLWKEIDRNPKATFNEMEQSINSVIIKFGYKLFLTTSNRDILDHQIVLPGPIERINIVPTNSSQQPSEAANQQPATTQNDPPTTSVETAATSPHE